jgi:hypothetical protein
LTKTRIKIFVSGTLRKVEIFLILELVTFIKQKMLKKLLLYLFILTQKQTTQTMSEVFKRLLYFNALFTLLTVIIGLFYLKS